MANKIIQMKDGAGNNIYPVTCFNILGEYVSTLPPYLAVYMWKRTA